MMKRTAAVVLAVVFILSSCRWNFSNEIVAYAAEGKTEEIPEGYTPVYDIADLYAIRNNVESNYILMNDIDMTEATSEGGDYDCGTGWDTIENFKGILDGNGHRIVGMHIFGEFTGIDFYFGLFERISSNAKIKNLSMVNCDIDVTVQGKYNYVNCCIGTLAGFASGADTYDRVNIINCYSSGKITVKCPVNTGDYAVYIGGLTGSLGSGILRNCYSLCEINGMEIEGNSYIGGICGEASLYNKLGDESEVACLYNIGNIKGSDRCQIGGICGKMRLENGKYEHCQYLKGSADKGTGNMDDDSYCVSLTDAQMKNERIFTGYDFSEVWEIDPYCSYPYPQLKNNRMVRVESICLKSDPVKIEYNQGDSLQLEDTQLEIMYEDGIKTSIPLTLDIVDGYDMMQIGEQTVIVTYGGKNTTFQITVKEVPVFDITIPETLTIYRSKTETLMPVITPENATDKSVTWESSDSDIVSVDDNGIVRGKSNGTAVITARTSNGLTANCTVTVLVPAVSIQLSHDSMTLEKGRSKYITAGLSPSDSTDVIIWTSDNPSVAEVYKGQITAKEAGTVVITATTTNGLTASCTVTVVIPAISIQLSQKNITLKEGENKSITAQILPYDSTDTIKWRSGNPSVAEVYNGRIAAKKAGTAIITAYADSGVQANCTVTVQKKTVQNSGNSSSANGKPNTVPSSPTDGKSNTSTSDAKNNLNAIRSVQSVKTKISKIKNTKSKKIKMKLSGMSGCDGYQIQYGIKKNFKGAKTITKKSNSVTIKKLKFKKTYYIRARVYKKISGSKYYGEWSGRKTIKIRQ